MPRLPKSQPDCCPHVPVSASEDFKLKLLESKMVPKDLTDIEEVEEPSSEAYAYIQDENGNPRKVQIGNIQGAVYTSGTGIIVNAESKVISIDSAVVATKTDLLTKADKSELPTKLSQLTNDTNFITKAVNDLTNYYTKTTVDEKIAAIKTIQFKVVQVLPATGEPNIIYLVPKPGTSGDIYDEYVYIDGKWEKIGTTAVDLSAYRKSADQDVIDAAIRAEKQDKITDLDSIRSKANSAVQPSEIADMATKTWTESQGYLKTHQDISHLATKTELTEGLAEVEAKIPDITPLATKAEVTEGLAGKVDKVTGKGLSTNDYTNEDKTLLQETAAAKHSHSNKLVIDSISDTDIANWNNKGTYSKPENGIPKTDLASAVQTSLNKADTALQEHQSLAAYRTSAAQDTIDAGKQDKLTAGTNIDITNNVIKALDQKIGLNFTTNTTVGGIAAGTAITADTTLANLIYRMLFDSTVHVTGVTLDRSSATINKNSSITLVATVSPSTATDKRVTWSSSNTEVATVDANGKVTGITNGSAAITVKTVDGNYTATCAITVVIPVTGVTIAPTSATINTGATQQLTSTVLPADATNKNVTYSSSNTSVATVSNTGLVTGVGEGSATITVKTQDGNFTATSTITVNAVPVAFDIYLGGVGNDDEQEDPSEADLENMTKVTLQNESQLIGQHSWTIVVGNSGMYSQKAGIVIPNNYKVTAWSTDEAGAYPVADIPENNTVAISGNRIMYYGDSPYYDYPDGAPHYITVAKR